MSTSAQLSTEDDAIVAAFDTVLEAEMARGRLESDGISARIVDGNTVGIATHLSVVLGGAKVVVACSDLEAARMILFAPSTTFPDLDETALANGSAIDDVAGARADTRVDVVTIAVQAGVIGLILGVLAVIIVAVV